MPHNAVNYRTEEEKNWRRKNEENEVNVVATNWTPPLDEKRVYFLLSVREEIVENKKGGTCCTP